MTQSDYHIHISSQHRWFQLNLKEVWQYRDLIYLFTKRSFVVSYKQTVLGPAWIFLTPLFSSIVQAFVFGEIAGIETDGVPVLLFYLCSNAIWTFFSTCLINNANTFTENAYVFGKVYFPRLTMPISNILSCAIRFGIQMILVLLFMVYFLIQGQVAPHWAAWLLIPLELVHLGVLGMGFGIIVSSMTTKYRDLGVLVGFGVSLWMYLTPIVYPLSIAAEGWMKTLLMLNPVTIPVEIIRYAVVGKGTFLWGYYGLSWLLTLAVALLGIMIFNKVERTFMDTV
ncbi:MAG TPA: ABC transporter permease [Candidatus Faecousia intestinavium]|nr:ABC transporter permease [Candidatus Faecousia intestinavium]